MIILNNTWTPYRSHLYNKMKRVEKIYYLCGIESTRRFTLKKSRKEIILSNIKFRNYLTPTQDFIISKIPLDLFFAKSLIVFGWSYWQLIMILFIRKLFGKRTYVFFESVLTNNSRNRIKNVIKRMFLSKDFIYLSPSKSCDLYLRQVLSNANLVRIPNYSLYEPKQQLVESSKRKIDFLFVGRNSPEKNIEMLKELYQKYQTQFKFLFVGDYFDFVDDEESKLYYVQDMEKIYLNSKFLLLPSINEPYGMVAIEAYSCGCVPLVSKNCGVASELPDQFTIDNDVDLNRIFEQYEKHFQTIVKDLHKFSLTNSISAFDEITEDIQ